MAAQLAKLSDVVTNAVNFGRLTALQKPEVGVRGIVTDVIRRLTARTMARKLTGAGKRVHRARSPGALQAHFSASDVGLERSGPRPPHVVTPVGSRVRGGAWP